jgi:hypothetical protein
MFDIVQGIIRWNYCVVVYAVTWSPTITRRSRLSA